VGASQLHPSRQVRWPPKPYIPAEAGFSTTYSDATFKREQRCIDLLEFLLVLDALQTDAPAVYDRAVAATAEALPIRQSRRPTRP